jgi:hypothetical protein
MTTWKFGNNPQQPETMMPTHPIEDCPHNPTFMHISKTLDRLDSHTERAAIAMEEMAAQGAILANHEARLNKHDLDLREVFGRVRIVENFQSKEEGAEEVVEKQQKFWDGVKQQVTPYALIGAVFIIYLLDKFNVSIFLAKVWKEMKG